MAISGSPITNLTRDRPHHPRRRHHPSLRSQARPAGLAGIVTGPDGNLWFTASGSRQDRRGSPPAATTSRVRRADPAASRKASPGPDGNIWFTESNGGKIGRITPDRRHHRIRGPDRERRPEDRRPAPTATSGSPNRGGQDRPDHARRGDHRVPDPARQQHPRSGSPPARTATSGSPRSATGKIGRITPPGVITEFPLPVRRSARKITAGPDGNLWFTGGPQQQDRAHRALSPPGQDLVPRRPSVRSSAGVSQDAAVPFPRAAHRRRARPPTPSHTGSPPGERSSERRQRLRTPAGETAPPGPFRAQCLSRREIRAL